MFLESFISLLSLKKWSLNAYKYFLGIHLLNYHKYSFFNPHFTEEEKDLERLKKLPKNWLGREINLSSVLQRWSFQLLHLPAPWYHMPLILNIWVKKPRVPYVQMNMECFSWREAVSSPLNSLNRIQLLHQMLTAEVCLGILHAQSYIPYYTWHAQDRVMLLNTLFRVWMALWISVPWS